MENTTDNEATIASLATQVAILRESITKMEARLIRVWEAIHDLERGVKIAQAQRVTEQAITKPDAQSEALWTELRAWRKEQSERDGKKPYNIFGDRTMAAIVANRPIDRYELKLIKGIGDATIERYAEDILAIVKRHGDADPNSEPW